MKKVIPLIITLALAVSCFADKRPNILFIFTDDHAPHAIGAYNGWLKSVNPTPNLDKLAKQGMVFENSFCTNSICGPSRAVIQTGKHSHKNGFMNNGNTFDWNQQTFPKLLQKVGYQTAIYGKSHLKGAPQGYDSWAVLPGQGLYYNPDFITPDGKITIEGYCTDIVTDMAVDYLENDLDKDRPFMMMVQHKAPHRCWMPALRHLDLYEDMEMPEPDTLFDKWEDNAPAARFQELEIDRHMDLNFDLFVDLTPDLSGPITEKKTDRSSWVNMQRMTDEQMKVWRAAYGPRDKAFHEANLKGDDLVRWKYQRYAKNYLRCVKGVDESVGRLMDTLKELKLDKNTIVIYSSDQGFYLGEHGLFDKRWMYEESLRTPLIVRWPGVVKAGTVNDTDIVSNIDFPETFLDVAGAGIPDDMQGHSLVPVLKGKTPSDWRKYHYYHYYEHGGHGVPIHFGVTDGRFKLIRYPTPEYDTWEFFDLKNDPMEMKSIYGQASPEKQQELLRQMNRLRKQYKLPTDETDGLNWKRQSNNH